MPPPPPPVLPPPLQTNVPCSSVSVSDESLYFIAVPLAGWGSNGSCSEGVIQML